MDRDELTAPQGLGRSNGGSLKCPAGVIQACESGTNEPDVIGQIIERDILAGAQQGAWRGIDSDNDSVGANCLRRKDDLLAKRDSGNGHTVAWLKVLPHEFVEANLILTAPQQ